MTGVRNVRTLRDCESAGLTASWNWLYGFPGETAGDYEAIVRQVPALVHLQPPAGAARILLERFSPYFDNRALGFPRQVSAEAYRHVYALAEEQLHDMVYLFDTDPAGVTDDEALLLHKVIDTWAEAYPDSSLRELDTGDEIVIRDRRAGWPAEDHRITDARLCQAYRELTEARSARAVLRRLAERGIDMTPEDLDGWLDGLASRGLVFHEAGQWLTLATSLEPIKVLNEVRGVPPTRGIPRSTPCRRTCRHTPCATPR